MEKYILRIEFKDNSFRAQHRVYKTESGCRKAAKNMMKKNPNIVCDVYQKIGTVKQLSMYDIPSDF